MRDYRPITGSDSSSFIIKEIEESIKNEDVIKLAKYINSKTYFSLMGNINGYYTTNQAFYLLQDFFKLNRIQMFKFNYLNLEANNPYATGTLIYENKGRRNKAHVYVSIKRIGENWIISQLSVN
jgi:hypothetical protein